ncbi:MAG: 30S ribosomal protein S2 [Candidatus Omnitrophica bacterium]|nr:30S ribosomal protein S2 [Candidatus Omnitrophota bacterium]
MAMRSKVIRELLENGVHFGHQTNKWNPKMEKYIFGERSGIYIIDLKKTEEALARAEEFLMTLAAERKTVLFAGTKKQAKDTIKDEAKRCGMFYVNERWLGGCLTNFTTIRKSVEKLNHIQEMKKSEVYESLSKKEKAHIDKDEYKLLKNLEGVREMNVLPNCLIVVDAEAENIAIKEARKIGIPVIALIDTNCDPEMIEYPIPGNDDAIRSVKYIVSTLAEAVLKGARGTIVPKKTESDEAEIKTPEAETKEPETAPEVIPPKEAATSEQVSNEEAAPKEPKKVSPEESGVKPASEDELLEGDIKLDTTEE